MGELERMFETYKNRVDFRIVYIREAHPSDGWQVEENEEEGVVFADPKTLEARAEVAKTCSRDLKLKIPVIVDTPDNAVEELYAGWPDRIYVIARDGTIAYKGAPGPRGFKPAEAQAALRELLARRSRHSR